MVVQAGSIGYWEHPRSLCNETTNTGSWTISLKSTLMRFGGLSGAGWLLDFVLLALLIRFAHWPAFSANLLSATIAAVLVFAVSRRAVFRGPEGGAAVRLLLYATYTLVIIVIASVAISLVSSLLNAAALHFGQDLTKSSAVLGAKIIVTPLNFILNFFAAKIMSEYDLSR